MYKTIFIALCCIASVYSTDNPIVDLLKNIDTKAIVTDIKNATEQWEKRSSILDNISSKDVQDFVNMKNYIIWLVNSPIVFHLAIAIIVSYATINTLLIIFQLVMCTRLFSVLRKNFSKTKKSKQNSNAKFP